MPRMPLVKEMERLDFFGSSVENSSVTFTSIPRNVNFVPFRGRGSCRTAHDAPVKMVSLSTRPESDKMQAQMPTTMRGMAEEPGEGEGGEEGFEYECENE